MKLIYEYNGKKNFILASLATFLCYSIILYIFSLIVFLVSYFGNSYSSDQLLVYLLLPLAAGFIVSMFSIISFRSVHTKLYKLHDVLIFDLDVKGLATDKYEFNKNDIIRIKKFSPMLIVGKTDIVIVATKYKKNNVIYDKKIRLCLALVCDFKTKKEITDLLKI